MQIGKQFGHFILTLSEKNTVDICIYVGSICICKCKCLCVCMSDTSGSCTGKVSRTKSHKPVDSCMFRSWSWKQQWQRQWIYFQERKRCRYCLWLTSYCGTEESIRISREFDLTAVVTFRIYLEPLIIMMMMLRSRVIIRWRWWRW
jgi:hypothetical protein